MMMDEKKKMMTKQVIIYAKMESSVVYVIAVIIQARIFIRVNMRYTQASLFTD